MNKFFHIAAFIVGLLMPLHWVNAKTFPLPKRGDDIVGSTYQVAVEKGDTFVTIAKQFDVGIFELQEANPGVDPKHPRVNTVLTIPACYILPNAPRESIVVNLAEMRIYYYPADKDEVMTFPVGIGRQGEATPEGAMTITKLVEKPTWRPPLEFLKMKKKEGVTFPSEVPPGPANPLGNYEMRLSHYPYLIHGTNDDRGVGRRSSAGCIRMYNGDVKQIFSKIKPGAPVLVISEPYKVGRHNGKVYLEAHLPLQEEKLHYAKLRAYLSKSIHGLVSYRKHPVNWSKAMKIAKRNDGIPQAVGVYK